MSEESKERLNAEAIKYQKSLLTQGKIKQELNASNNEKQLTVANNDEKTIKSMTENGWFHNFKLSPGSVLRCINISHDL